MVGNRKKKLSSDSESSVSPPYQRTKRSKRSTENETEAATTSIAANRRTLANSTKNNSRHTTQNPSCGPTIQSAFNRCGKIIAVRLRNFMCHSHLYVEFGPNINFLVGSNGSGKSAVITALALGLASSARATSRASSLQKLVKNGESSATIELTLSNTGMRPYKSEIFGPQITVVRHIRQTSSVYELRDARNKSVSKKLEDIRRLLLFFGINVVNPIFVLNQEASREFLKDMEPASNYRLVMKATQLDLCSASLNQCHDKREQFSFDLEIMKKKEDKLKKLCQDEEEKLTIVKNKEAITKQLNDASTILAWLKVKKIQEDLTKLHHTLKVIEKKNMELSQKTNQKNVTQDTLAQQLKECETKKSQILETSTSQHIKVRDSRRKAQEYQCKAGSIRAKINNVDKRLKEEQAAYEGCKNHMKNYNEEYSEIKRLKDQNIEQLKTLKKRQTQTNELITQLRGEQNDIKNRIPSIKEHVESIKNELNGLHKSEQSLKWEMDSLLRNKSNKMSVYGEQAMQVANTLQSKYLGSDSHNMPRGPIGMYITVPNPKYRDLIENQLAHCLRSYIVSNDKDRIYLRNLLQKSFPGGRIPTIITSSFTSRVYDVSRHKVEARSSNTTVLMDEIRCEDPVVMNYLIDTMRIETVLVTDSKETAESLTSNSENVPPNLTRVLVPNLRLEYCPSPNYAVYSISIASARFIQVNVDDRIRQLKKEHAQVLERSANINSEYIKDKQKLDREYQEISGKRDAINAHQNTIEKLVQKIMDIENFEYRELPALNVIETHLNSCVEKIETFKQERVNLDTQLREIEEQKTSADLEAANEQKALDEINQQAGEIDVQTHDLENKLSDLDRYHEENQRRFKQTNDMIKTTLKEKINMENTLETARQAAQTVGDFIETDQSEEKIHERISRYKAKIKHFESMNINSEEVEQKLCTLRENLTTHTDTLGRILSLVEKMRIAYHTRAQRFQRSRSHFFTMVQFQFKQALLCRQFEGDLNVNHREKLLHINVYPPSGNKTSNTRSLSGGERSFTTVSLLKGLWSTSDHPFYFLDEYDVFTDEVNRTFITKLLIQEGMDFKNRQYCFLTPQDTKVDAHHLIRVHKLEAPER